MAQVIRKPIPVVVKPVVKAGVKPTVRPVSEGFQVVSIDSIEFLSSGRGGGKPMDPAVAKLVDKALTLQIGQGIKVPVAMRIDRTINGANGESILKTYQGAQTLSKRSTASGMRFRTRMDTSENLWLFRAEPYTQEQVDARAEARELRKAEKAA